MLFRFGYSGSVGQRPSNTREEQGASMELRERYRGCLLAMACGDALGAGIEFMAPEAIKARFGLVTDFAGGGPFNWPVGAHTDDTEMALCLSESLIEHPQGDLADIASRWLTWLKSDPPDVGNLTRDGLIRAQSYMDQGEDPRLGGKGAWEATGCDSAGNGSLMRVAPVALLFAQHPERMLQLADETSQITHYDPRCRASCMVFCLALAEILTSDTRGVVDLKALADAVRELSEVTADAVLSVFDLDAGNVSTTGYCLDTLQAALWPMDRALGLEEGIVTIVNLGYDADTCGAVAGALLGARDGEGAIPDRWLKGLREADRIREAADRLYEQAAALKD